MAISCYEIDDSCKYTIKVTDILHDLDIPYCIESTQILTEKPIKIQRHWILIDDKHIHNILAIFSALNRQLKLL